jgi:predicted RNA binding protein YcfA (HicA-like mRNA interferase family)
MKTISRKSIVKVLSKNGFVEHRRNRKGMQGGSHQKYKKCIEGKIVTTVLTIEKDYHVRTVQMISKQTGIPIEVFMRNTGSKKFKNGNGNVFSLCG